MNEIISKIKNECDWVTGYKDYVIEHLEMGLCLKIGRTRLVMMYKGKCKKDDCKNCRDISLLLVSVCGKDVWKNLINHVSGITDRSGEE